MTSCCSGSILRSRRTTARASGTGRPSCSNPPIRSRMRPKASARPSSAIACQTDYAKGEQARKVEDGQAAHYKYLDLLGIRFYPPPIPACTLPTWRALFMHDLPQSELLMEHLRNPSIDRRRAGGTDSADTCFASHSPQGADSQRHPCGTSLFWILANVWLFGCLVVWLFVCCSMFLDAVNA